MSEVRETTTIESITVPEPEPVLSFAQLLADIGPLTRNASALPRLERGGMKRSNAVSFATSSSLVQIGSLIRHAKTAKEAIQLLSAEIPLNVSSSEANQWKTILRRASESNDKDTLARAVAQIAGRQQDRIQQSVISISQKVLAGRGFSSQITNSREGLIVAKRPGSEQTMTIDVSRSNSGEISMKFDLDGFYGEGCIDALNEVQEDLAKAGVRTTTISRQRKDPRAQYDGERLPHNTINLNCTQSS